MHKGERLRFVAIVGVVVAVLSAGFALAGDAFDDPADEPTSTCEPTDGVVDDGDAAEDPEGVEGEEPVEGEEAVEGDTEECDDPAEGEEAVEDDEPEAGADLGVDASQAQDYTAEDCLAAAGDAEGEGPDEKPVPGELHGRENAIAHLLWNCLDHPNHGLVNALTKHSLKLDAWLERQELKAERKAERDAAKAERDAAHDAAKAEREAAREAAKAARDLSHSS